MRRLVLLAAFLALVGCPSALAAPVFYMWGKGWGHGIGLSQWGAYGYATHGWGYRDILARYYPGTEVGQATRVVDVVLASGRTSVRVSSPERWKIRGAGGEWLEVAGGASKTIGTDLRVRIGGKIRKLDAPVTAAPIAGVVALDGRPYRGKLVLRKESGLTVVNHLGMERYLLGVVPSEMPASWHIEALKAQAVAARTYAMRFQSLSATTSSQVYGGVWAEQPNATAAIEATAGEIRTWNGQPAETFFSASSGGWTAAKEDVWPGAPAVPYLKPVRDRYDGMPGNPNHRWGPDRFSRTAFDARLGSMVAGKLRDLRTTTADGRRVAVVTIVGSGGTNEVSGWDFRINGGFKSTWFRIGVMDIRAGRSTIQRGESVLLKGLARSVGEAWLERRAPGGTWQKRNTLDLTSSRFQTRVSPRVSRYFRVNSARGASRAKLIRVETKVRFYQPSDRTALAGLVKPRRQGVIVELQRRTGGSWTTVEKGKTKPSGEFRIALDVADGSYRALADAPGAAPGASPTLKVVS